MQGNGAIDTAAEEKVSILVVDDRPDKLLTYQVMLEPLHQRIVEARSGPEALRALLQEDFSVILLDVNMPGMDGFETAAMIRKRPRSESTPIIFISAVNDTVNHVSRGYSLGAVDYILTPVIPEILRTKIAVFVDLFRKTEQIKRQADERAKLLSEQAARAEAEARQQRLGFLADASRALALSLESQDTFQTLASLIVPRLADYCIVDIADENGELQPVAEAQRDDPKLQTIGQRYARSATAKKFAGRVFKQQRAAICCQNDDVTLRNFFGTKEGAKFARELGVSSMIAVPLCARDRTLGVITMINATSDHACGGGELSLAEELAQRAALAVDNAALYKTARAARTDAERANMEKDRFLAMLSHELRTPLTPVLASVAALENEEELSGETRDALQLIRRNVELEARLIDDLLDLTRISKGKLQLNAESVDLHELLRRTIDICQSDIRLKQQSLETDLAAERTQVEADPARLQQIFWNLLKNAVKFTPARGRVSIRTGNENGEVRVEVSDSGCGISDEALPKIFNAFEQGERAYAGGLGLGLAITKALVEAHRGRISAESAGRGLGATFTALFPITDKQERVAAPASPREMGERKSKRILLVEDHHDTNRSLTVLLRRRGYEVESVYDVASALSIAAHREFDILISDIGLPDGSGIDVMSRLRSRGPVVGIALSGFGMEEDVRRSYDVGFTHHLVKPVDLNKLDSLIQASDAAR